MKEDDFRKVSLKNLVQKNTVIVATNSETNSAIQVVLQHVVNTLKRPLNFQHVSFCACGMMMTLHLTKNSNRFLHVS